MHLCAFWLVELQPRGAPLTRLWCAQVACAAPAPFACGALLLTSEVLREQPALWAAALHAEEGDGEERFQDAPLPADDGDEGEGDPDSVKRRERAERHTLSARFELSDSEEVGPARKRPPQVLDDAAGGGADGATAPRPRPGGGLGRALPGGYDMAKRDPQHAGAERAGLWELPLLAAHMHPSVAAMARSLLAGAHVSYDGDPLRDMALAAFLDRWLQKKPKAAKVANDAAARMGRRAAAAEKAAPGSAEFTAMLVRLLLLRCVAFSFRFCCCVRRRLSCSLLALAGGGC